MMVVVKGDATVSDLCQLSWLQTPGTSSSSYKNAIDQVALGVVLLHASWNNLPAAQLEETVRTWTKSVMRQQGWIEMTDTDQSTHLSAVIPFGAVVRVDESAESMRLYTGEGVDANDEIHETLHTGSPVPLPPYDLPAIAIVTQLLPSIPSIKVGRASWNFVANIRSMDLLCAIRRATDCSSSLYCSKILRPIQAALKRSECQYQTTTGLWDAMASSRRQSTALRIFVAGDRSSVGKSSVCLGILGALIASGFATPETLAYIKPATQSESTQLIQLYCEQQGIQCVAVGPLVYYRGFTRAFLAGEAASTEELLKRCCDAVDDVARGKKVVLIDGVGFPAVGSICGTSNAAVAQACGYPPPYRSSLEVAAVSDTSHRTKRRTPLGVVLVGGSGVGAAIDSFNLNASYFEHQAALPVLGGIFNKLSTEGYYSLESCRSQVTTYFQTDGVQIERGRKAFGFVPSFPRIAGKHALDCIDEYLHMFRQHVDIIGILDAAQRVKLSEATRLVAEGTPNHALNAQKSAPVTVIITPYVLPVDQKGRREIEALAIAAGAAPSA